MSERDWLAEAVELSRRAPRSDGAFSVGAMLVGADGGLIATGFSREEQPSDHAEEVALRRAEEAGVSTNGATMYTSLEPCSRRLSGRTSCTQRIIDAGIARVVYVLAEPPVFVDCEGTAQLRAAGVDVEVRHDLADAVRQINAHLES